MELNPHRQENILGTQLRTDDKMFQETEAFLFYTILIIK